MFRYSFFLHPFPYLDGLEMGSIEAFSQVVVIHPFWCRPQARLEVRCHVEFLVAASLAMMSHLKIVTIKVKVLQRYGRTVLP